MTNLELEIIKSAGIVGAGGAGFPTHIKLGTKVETLIVNGAECEPLIHVDKQLIQYYFEKIFKGISFAANIVGANRVVIALKEKYKKAIEKIEEFQNKLERQAKSIDTINQHDIKLEIFKLGNFYPAGDEQVLVYEVTKKIVPEGGIPLMVGAVVVNVETLLNICNAINGRNVITKFVTVNGEIANPQTLEVPVGTPINLLIDYCGGPTTNSFAVLDGGPMMGKLIDKDSYAVKKTTKSIVVLPSESIIIQHKLRDIRRAVKQAQAICLSCRMCTDLCPRYLLGHQLYPDEMMKKMYKGSLEEDKFEMFDFAYLCCDCGLCELYSCVVDLSARSLFNYIKAELSAKGIKSTHNRKDILANEFREYRKVPVERLEKRLEIDKYESSAPLSEFKAIVKEVKLYLLQHVGVPSVPIVKTGDYVVKGQVVAEILEGKVGAKVHSSITGTV